MQFTPTHTLLGITTNIVEVRTYRLLQELNDIESDESKNPNTLDNVNSERDEQTGAITASIIIPFHMSLSNGLLVPTIINPYQITENIVAAFFESVFAQWLGEQSVANNPTQSKYITMTPVFIPRESPETGGNNATITFTISGLPTVRDNGGDSINIRGGEYLQGTLGD